MKWWLTCIRKYVTFEGRARRKEYWMFTLFNVVFVVVTMLLDILLFGATPDNPTSPRYLTTLYGLFVFLPTLTVVVRRLHDIGRSGWWLAGYYGVAFVCTILMMIGSVLMLGGKGSGMALTGGGFAVLMITAVWMIVWMCFDSQAGENKYGPQPQADCRSGRVRGACRRCRAVGAGDSESGVTGFRRRICVVPARNDALFFYFCGDECE